jgi:hypothetical protein
MVVQRLNAFSHQWHEVEEEVGVTCNKADIHYRCDRQYIVHQSRESNYIASLYSLIVSHYLYEIITSR